MSPLVVRLSVGVAVGCLVVGALAGCSAGPSPAQVPDASPGRVGTGTGPGSPGLHLAPGGPAELRLPSGRPLRLRLPRGATATLDPSGDRPQVVVAVSDAALGFGRGEDVPADPAAADRILGEVMTALRQGSRADIGTVQVTGYASSEGSTMANQALSEARAAWVCRSLVSSGVPADELTCTGRGEGDDRPPRGPGPEDRRVEIRVGTDAG